MKGRKPKPSALRLLQGNPGRRPYNNREPKFSPGAPDCPPHLDALGRQEWFRVTAELDAQNLLTKVDRGAISIYCSNWSRYVKCERILDKSSMREVVKGRVQNHGLLRVSNACQDRMMKVIVEYGFTASSRTRIHASARGDQDDVDDKFFG